MQSQLIQHEVQAMMGNRQAEGKVFQVFGFDILLDEDYNAWILEVNDHPSFNIMYSKEFMGNKQEDEILSRVDLHVKHQVMAEALTLAAKSKKKLDEIGDRFKHCTRIMPCSEADHVFVGQMMQNTRSLFYKLCLIRDKKNLSSGNFEKLHTHPVMKQAGMQRPRL